MSPPAIPEKASFQAWAEVWLPMHASKIIDTTVSDADGRMFACYYDVAQWAYACKAAGLITSSVCDSLIANWISTYRDSYLAGSNYNPTIFYMMSTGLAKHYLANTGANGASKTALASLKSNCPYIWTATVGDQAKYNDIHYAREVAFSLIFLINNNLVGNDATIDTRAATWKGYCLTLLDNWRNGVANYTQFYIRPFMVALVTDALIYYGENVSALSTADMDKIDATWDYLHNLLYRSSDTHPSLKFTSVHLDTMSRTSPATTEQATLVDQNQDPANQDGPGTDVSMMHVHIYAWLYKQGYRGSTWQTRADDIFINGYPHYIHDNNYAAGQYYQNYGAFVGTRTLAGINGKHTSQQMFRFAEFVRDREAGPSVSSPTYTGGSVTAKAGFCKFNKVGFFGRGGTAAASYSPATFYSGGTLQYWFDLTNSAKVLNSGGTSAAAAANVQTVNDALGGALSMVQATGANQGVVATGLGTNSKQGLAVTGSPMTYALTGTGNTGILKSATKVSFGVTFKLNGTGANARFHRQVDSTFTDNIFNAFLATATPSLDMATTSTGQTTSISNQTLSTGSIYFVLYEWDVANHTGSIKVNNAGTLSTSAFPTGSTIENLNANTAPDLISLANVTLLDMFLYTGALNSNVAGHYAALQSKIGF